MPDIPNSRPDSLALPSPSCLANVAHSQSWAMERDDLEVVAQVKIPCHTIPSRGRGPVGGSQNHGKSSNRVLGDQGDHGDCALFVLFCRLVIIPASAVSLIAGQLLINGTDLATPYFESIGVTMHPLLGRINHSCRPNAMIRSNGATTWTLPFISVVAIEGIEAGDEITVSYLESTACLGARQHTLQNKFFFTCRCDKCVDDVSEGRISFPYSHLADTAVKVDDLLDSGNDTTSVARRIEHWRYALHLLLDAGMPIINLPYRNIIRRIVFAYIDDHQFSLAFAYALVLHFRVVREIPDYTVTPTEKAMYKYLLYRLMDCIIGAQNWAGQKLDLVPRELQLAYWRWRMARDLHRLPKGTLSGYMDDCVSREVTVLQVTEGKFEDAVVDDVEKQKLAMEGLDRLMDDVLENSKTWKGEIS